MTQKHIYDKDFRYTPSHKMENDYLWRKFGFDKKQPPQPRKTK